MITIKGISKRHVQLLDEMWACESFEQFESWKSTHSEQDQLIIDSLMRMVLAECIDNDLGDMSEAKEVLSRF
ncbi:hypothetical protein UFOVP240_88 [uncultured Caudovirales phage]|uniref:Uncharacterized protein n=1 Tax=uncultured Caudovirales phage TaxID=2100421 RepID=A0A6J7WTT0_9CAUD|nr:hypothetical protein UFOVP240_88 [uncultured Caudovirales phage]